jgi:rare lipoprotein A
MQTVPLGAGGAIPWPFFHPRRLVKRPWLGIGLVVLTLTLAGTGQARADSIEITGSKVVQASWYGREFAWRRTASGERFDPMDLTCAHRSLPMGTRVRVTNLLNGRSVLVTINDRGPFQRRREIDLSYGAARALGMVQRGVAQVRIELVES